MTNIRMKAVDTLHLSALGPDNILPGGEFEVPSAVADDLEKRGLAERLGEAKAVKAAPANKAAPAPQNKGLISASGVTSPAKPKGRK